MGAISAEQVILDSGRVRIDEHGRVFWKKNGRRAENKTGIGYLQVRVMIAGRRYHVGAHRLVWTHFNGPIPPGKVINHDNGKKSDNRPQNLECCTPSDNNSHAHRTGLCDQRGERNPSAKLSASDVEAIRARYTDGGVTMHQLGAAYGVSFKTISKIVRGERRAADGGPTADYTSRRSSAKRKAAGNVLDGRTHLEWPR